MMEGVVYDMREMHEKKGIGFVTIHCDPEHATYSNVMLDSTHDGGLQLLTTKGQRADSDVMEPGYTVRFDDGCVYISGFIRKVGHDYLYLRKQWWLIPKTVITEEE